jgi:hypothetical protein
MLDSHGPFAPPKEPSTFRGGHIEKLGSSLGVVGSSNLAIASRGAVCIEHPQPVTPSARLADNGRDYITESPARAKARATQFMGMGYKDGWAGYEPKTKWAQDVQSRALQGSLRLLAASGLV